MRAPSEVSDNSDVRGKEWRTPEPTDLIFPKWQSELFKTITEEENLRFDRDGRPRTAYSLRHTYISMRLMEGANIYQIAKNCRTSVGMIEKYYGVHVKNSLNAAAINVVSSGKDVMAEEFEDLMEEEEEMSASLGYRPLPRNQACLAHGYRHLTTQYIRLFSCNQHN